MAGKYSQTATYNQYVASLRPLLLAKSVEDLPKLVAITGSSIYLQQRTCQALISVWKKFDLGDAQSIEASEVNHAEFRSLWSQVSLFEPRSFYVLRRANQNRAISSWLGEIKIPEHVKSNLVLEFSEKITADTSKHLKRLGGCVIQCEEPTATLEYEKVTEAFCKRRGLLLDQDAIKLVVDSMGQDLSKIENQIEALSLQFSGVTRNLTRSDIASSIGALREDDVFELFESLRRGKLSQAHLLCESFIDRGESAIALTGIFSRIAREQLERGNPRKGLAALKACSLADRLLKSSKVDEAIIMSSIIESFSEA